MNRELASWIVAGIRPPLLLLRWLLSPVYHFCFDGLDERTAERNHARLRQDIRRSLPFLFDDWGATLMPMSPSEYPRAFDYAVVIVCLSDCALRFIRGRGELRVDVSSKKVPAEWHSLDLFLQAMNGEQDLRRNQNYGLLDIVDSLRLQVQTLNSAFTHGNSDQIVRRLEDEVYSSDRIAMRNLERELNRRRRS